MNTRRSVFWVGLVCAASLTVPQVVLRHWKVVLSASEVGNDWTAGEIVGMSGGGVVSPGETIATNKEVGKKWPDTDQSLNASAIEDTEGASLARADAPIQGHDGLEEVVGPPGVEVNTTVIRWEGWKFVQDFIFHYFSGNLFCETIDDVRKEVSSAAVPITVNISFGCQEFFDKGLSGTGNVIWAFYGLRLASQVYENVDIHISCPDAEATKKDLILPWVMGWFPPRRLGSTSRYPMVKIQQACGIYGDIPLQLMYNEMRHDFRRMAIGLVGVPGPDHASAPFADNYFWSENAGRHNWSIVDPQITTPRREDNPIFPKGSIELDDAVIHFRCGDLMNSDNPHYVFSNFRGYTKRISPEVRSIGILTQPFDNDAQTRWVDTVDPMAQNRCRVIVMSLVDFMKKRFPSSRIKIHNGRHETVALAYARMIMANQTFAGPSSFGIFPTLATFGTGHLLIPPELPGIGMNRWFIRPRIDELTDNVVLVSENQTLLVADFKKLWDSGGKEAVLEWFWKDDTLSE